MHTDLESSGTAAPFCYQLYGQKLCSTRPLALPTTDQKYDSSFTMIREDWPSRFQLPDSQSWFESYLQDGFRILRWQGIGAFAVGDSGRTVYMRLDPRTPWSVVQAYLLTQVLSEALLQRGEESLHGVAVEKDGKALLFLGPSGMGKSTLLLHLLAAGARFISDDLLILKPKRHEYCVCHGLPRLKLYEDSWNSSSLKAQKAMKLSPYTDKSIYELDPAFVAEDELVPIERIYVLRREQAAKPECRELSGREKFVALAENAFNSIDGSISRSRVQLRTLAGWTGIRVNELIIPQGLQMLPEVTQWILRLGNI